jgi:endoglucanase
MMDTRQRLVRKKPPARVALAGGAFLAATVLTAGMATSAAAATPTAQPTSEEAHSGTLLPRGYLSTSGSQIVGRNGKPVRIDAVATFGSNALDQNTFINETSPLSLEGNVKAMKAAGFNTLTIGWNDASLHGSDATAYMDGIKTVVGAAASVGLKVILNHHDDEGVAGDTTFDCMAQQFNGLWYDEGPGTDGTDGCGTTGTVTQARFLSDWEEFARAFAGNPTVIGFDLDNEPLAYPGDSTWGGGGPTDIRQMYSAVGSKLEAIDPGVLIICEGPQNYGGNFAQIPGLDTPEGDLTLAGEDPVTLTDKGRPAENKVVYSVHEYPDAVAGFEPDSGPAAVARYNEDWGYLVSTNIAPVWIGESGFVPMNTADETAWAQTFTSYVNGRDGDQGGPEFKGDEQGVSTTWYNWTVNTNGEPGGTITATGALVPAIRAVYSQWQVNLAKQYGS